MSVFAYGLGNLWGRLALSAIGRNCQAGGELTPERLPE